MLSETALHLHVEFVAYSGNIKTPLTFSDYAINAIQTKPHAWTILTKFEVGLLTTKANSRLLPKEVGNVKYDKRSNAQFLNLSCTRKFNTSDLPTNLDLIRHGASYLSAKLVASTAMAFFLALRAEKFRFIALRVNSSPVTAGYFFSGP